MNINTIFWYRTVPYRYFNLFHFMFLSKKTKTWEFFVLCTGTVKYGIFTWCHLIVRFVLQVSNTFPILQATVPYLTAPGTYFEKVSTSCKNNFLEFFSYLQMYVRMDKSKLKYHILLFGTLRTYEGELSTIHIFF